MARWAKSLLIVTIGSFALFGTGRHGWTQTNDAPPDASPEILQSTTLVEADVSDVEIAQATQPTAPAAGATSPGTGTKPPTLPETNVVGQQQQGTPPTLPETEVVGQQQQGAAQQQASAPPSQPVNNEVTGPRILQGTIFASPPVRGYNAGSSTVGTFLNTPDRIFPGTINSITRDTLRDQQILTMDELLRDVAGAVKAYGADGVIRPDQFFIRGFEVTSQNWRKDGYLDPTYMPRDPANMERVDVLAGPASVLYGSAQPAGTWNVTTKLAQANSFYTGGFMTGSYGLQRYTVDANSPLNADGTLLFRINAAYQNSDSFVQSVFNERTFVAPTLTWVIDDDTSLTWSGEYQKDRFRMYQGIPAINGDPFAISRNTFTGDPNGDVADYTSYRSTLTFTKILNDNWTMKVGGMSLWYNTPSTTTLLDNGTTDPTSGLLTSPLIPRDQSVANPFQEQNHDILETLAGEFDTAGVDHHMVVGAEQDWFITNHDTFTTSSTTNFLTNGSGSAYPPINVASGGPFPVGAPINTYPTAVYTQNVFDNPSFRQNRFGFFSQDIMDLTDRLHLLVGGRYDYLSQEYARSDTLVYPSLGYSYPYIPEFRTVDTFGQFSPRAGLTYDLVPDTLSAYAMYSRSFSPSIGVSNFSGATPLLPEIGNIWEGGFKWQINQAFNARLSGYWIKQNNVNVEQFDSTPGAPVPFFTTQAGVQRSQGVETALTGQLSERLSTISNFAYNDSYLYGIAQPLIDQGPPLDQSRVRGVPHWTGNVWLRYNFVQEQRRTLGMALGMRYVGSRLGDYAAPLTLPAYDVWDLGFYYNRGRFGGSLLWDNIFNVNYAVSSISQYQVMPGMPSNVRLQGSYTF